MEIERYNQIIKLPRQSWDATKGLKLFPVPLTLIVSINLSNPHPSDEKVNSQ